MTVEVPLLLMLFLVAEENAEVEMLLLVSEPVEVMAVLLLEKETVEEEREAREEVEEVETVLLLLMKLVETGSELVGEAMLEVLLNGMLLLGDDGPTVERDEVVLLLLTGEVLLGDGEVVDDVVPLFGTDALVEEAVLFGDRLVEETEGPLVGETVLELFVNGILLEDGPTVEEAVLLLAGEVLLADSEVVLFVVGAGLLAADALAEEAVLFGNRLLLDGALLVGTLPVEDAVVPLEDTDDDVGRLPVDEAVLFTKGELVSALLVGTLPVGDKAEVPFEEANDVGMLVVDEAVLFTRPVELDALLVEGPTVDVLLAIEELIADDDGEVPFDDAEDVGRVAVDEDMLLMEGVLDAGTPLVEGRTVDVLLAREELAGVDDVVLFVTGVVLGMPLVEAAEVGVTVPSLEGELFGMMVPVEEAVLLREPVLEDTPLPDGAVD